jgi:TBC1 domain family protein 5
VKGLVNPNSKNNSPILQRIVQIQDQKLKMLDLELFRILKLQDVKTKTFLLRWIRCLHTREFGLIDSLTIWDSIFLDALESPTSKAKHQYEFVDAVCIAMFIYMRTIVLTR